MICRSTVSERELFQDESKEVPGKLYLIHAGESPDTNFRAALPKCITFKRQISHLPSSCCVEKINAFVDCFLYTTLIQDILVNEENAHAYNFFPY